MLLVPIFDNQWLELPHRLHRKANRLTGIHSLQDLGVFDNPASFTMTWGLSVDEIAPLAYVELSFTVADSKTTTSPSLPSCNRPCSFIGSKPLSPRCLAVI